MNKSKKIKKLMKKSLSSVDILKNTDGDCKIMTYKELQNYDNMKDLFGKKKCIFLLYESKRNYGHWVLIIKRDEDKNKETSYEHFNSYSSFPDNELEFIPINFKKHNNMYYPSLTYLYYMSGKKIHFNDYQLQSYNFNTRTCGRFVLVRYWLKKLNIDEFNSLFKDIKDKDKYITYLTELI